MYFITYFFLNFYHCFKLIIFIIYLVNTNLIYNVNCNRQRPHSNIAAATCLKSSNIQEAYAWQHSVGQHLSSSPKACYTFFRNALKIH